MSQQIDNPLDGRGTPAPDPPTIAELSERIEDLPHYMSALARRAINGAGTTAAHLLWLADRADEAAAECRMQDVRGLMEPEAAAWADLANIMRDAAPRFPHPPRVPLSAEEADSAVLARRVFAAGLSTAGGS